MRKDAEKMTQCECPALYLKDKARQTEEGRKVL